MAGAQMAVSRLPLSVQAIARRGVTDAFVQGFHRGSFVAALLLAAASVPVFRFLPSGRVPGNDREGLRSLDPL
jgi:hypothetical protein